MFVRKKFFFHFISFSFLFFSSLFLKASFVFTIKQNFLSPANNQQLCSLARSNKETSAKAEVLGLLIIRNNKKGSLKLIPLLIES